MSTITESLGEIADGTTVLASDPCYLIEGDDRDQLVYRDSDLHSVNPAPLLGGQWEAWADEIDEGVWGTRIAQSGIHLLGGPMPTHTTEAVQGVDAGMVGYFIGEPRLSYEDTWQLDGELHPDQARLIHRPVGQAWVTNSGFGDGAYPVTVLWFHNLIIGIQTEFIGEEDED